MKLTWTKAQNGNWNGKRGSYTLVTVDYHDEGDMSGWWVHPKLPGLKGQRVNGPVMGREIADHLFIDWILEVTK
jgi:hypothetical protein